MWKDSLYIYIGGAFGLICAQSKSEILSCLSFCGDILLKNKSLLLVNSILFFLHLVFHQLMHWLVRHFCLKFTSLLCTIYIFIHTKFYIEIMVQKAILFWSRTYCWPFFLTRIMNLGSEHWIGGYYSLQTSLNHVEGMQLTKHFFHIP